MPQLQDRQDLTSQGLKLEPSGITESPQKLSCLHVVSKHDTGGDLHPSRVTAESQVIPQTAWKGRAGVPSPDQGTPPGIAWQTGETCSLKTRAKWEQSRSQLGSWIPAMKGIY